jgi:hypothetical protein
MEAVQRDIGLPTCGDAGLASRKEKRCTIHSAIVENRILVQDILIPEKEVTLLQSASLHCGRAARLASPSNMLLGRNGLTARMGDC